MQRVENFINGVVVVVIICAIFTIIAAFFYSILDLRSIAAFVIVGAVISGVTHDNNNLHPKVDAGLTASFSLIVGLCILWGMTSLAGIIPVAVLIVGFYWSQSHYDSEGKDWINLGVGAITDIGLFLGILLGSVRWFSELDPTRVVIVSLVGFIVFVIAFVRSKNKLPIIYPYI